MVSNKSFSLFSPIITSISRRRYIGISQRTRNHCSIFHVQQAVKTPVPFSFQQHCFLSRFLLFHVQAHMCISLILKTNCILILEKSDIREESHTERLHSFFGFHAKLYMHICASHCPGRKQKCLIWMEDLKRIINEGTIYQ